MKQIYFIFLLIISINFANQAKIQTLSEKVVVKFKCLFATPEKIEVLSDIFESLFVDPFMLVFIKVMNLLPILETCFGIDIMEIIKKLIPSMQSFQVQQQIMLYNVQNYNAPLLLRKYLYDTAINTNVINAKKECIDVTKKIPYDKYKNICNIFEFKEK